MLLPNGNYIALTNTCPIDNFLFIITCAIHKDQTLITLFNNTPILKTITNYLVTFNYSEAKYAWLTLCENHINKTRRNWNAFGTNKNLVLLPLNPLINRKYTYTCSFNDCRLSKSTTNFGNIKEVTLHLPENSQNVDSSTCFEIAIAAWCTGGHEFTCKHEFNTEPDHSAYIATVDHQRTFYKCIGDATVQNISFVSTPNLIVFDVNEELASRFNLLSELPKVINIYSQQFNLYGCTSFISGGEHYTGYVLDKTSDTLFLYDAIHHRDFGKRSTLEIVGKISLCVYIKEQEKQMKSCK